MEIDSKLGRCKVRSKIAGVQDVAILCTVPRWTMYYIKMYTSLGVQQSDHFALATLLVELGNF